MACSLPPGAKPERLSRSTPWLLLLLVLLLVKLSGCQHVQSIARSSGGPNINETPSVLCSSSRYSSGLLCMQAYLHSSKDAAYTLCMRAGCAIIVLPCPGMNTGPVQHLGLLDSSELLNCAVTCWQGSYHKSIFSAESGLHTSPAAANTGESPGQGPHAAAAPTVTR
jgi:hypothetical protein